MGFRVAATTLLLGAVLVVVAACGVDGDPEANTSGSPVMEDPFAMAAISQLETLESLTLWRVGQHARGPGRDPDEAIAVVAANNHTGWAYSIDGDGRFDSTHLPGTPPDASERDAQAAVVRVVEDATGRAVRAAWVELDADTWTASASFPD